MVNTRNSNIDTGGNDGDSSGSERHNWSMDQTEVYNFALNTLRLSENTSVFLAENIDSDTLRILTVQTDKAFWECTTYSLPIQDVVKFNTYLHWIDRVGHVASLDRVPELAEMAGQNAAARHRAPVSVQPRPSTTHATAKLVIRPLEPLTSFKGDWHAFKRAAIGYFTACGFKDILCDKAKAAADPNGNAAVAGVLHTALLGSNHSHVTMDEKNGDTIQGDGYEIWNELIRKNETSFINKAKADLLKQKITNMSDKNSLFKQGANPANHNNRFLQLINSYRLYSKVKPTDEEVLSWYTATLSPEFTPTYMTYVKDPTGESLELLMNDLELDFTTNFHKFKSSKRKLKGEENSESEKPNPKKKLKKDKRKSEKGKNPKSGGKKNNKPKRFFYLPEHWELLTEKQQKAYVKGDLSKDQVDEYLVGKKNIAKSDIVEAKPPSNQNANQPKEGKNSKKKKVRRTASVTTPTSEAIADILQPDKGSEEEMDVDSVNGEISLDSLGE